MKSNQLPDSRAGMVTSSSRRRGGLLLSIGTLLALILSLFAAPLAAQDGSTSQVDFEVLQVDVRQGTGTVVVRPAAGAEPADLIVEIEGEEIITSTAPIFRSSITNDTILVVDDSENADAITGFATIRQAALAYIDGVSADTRLALVRAGGGRLETQLEVNFTTDHQTVRDAINGLSAGGPAVTFNAIADSVVAFNGDGPVRNVVAFVGSTGGSSTDSPNVARGRLLGANAGFAVVAPSTRNLDISGFSQIADEVRGGAVFRGIDQETDMIAAARDAAQVHESSLVGSFPTSSIIDARSENGTGEDGTNELVASIGDSSERVRILPNGFVDGSALDAPLVADSGRFGILRGNLLALIAIAVIVIAVLIFAFTIMSILLGADNSLNSTLSVYGAVDTRTDEQAAADDAFASNRSRIIEQVVERAEEAAEARGNLNSTSRLLEKAEIPLRVGEAFAIQVGLVLFAFIIGFLIFGTSLIGGIFLAIPAALIPIAFVKYKVAKRGKKLQKQLPDVLTLLASTLKGGYSFLQGMDAVGNEAEEPLAGEFRRTVNEARLGKDMDDALDDLAARVESQDMLWAIVAIKIQREVGGNLAELLTTVAETMNSRQRLRGEVSALTAEGRISAYVLLVLPFGVALAMWFLNPDYLSELWTNTLGFVAIGVSIVAMTIGAFWMRKIVDIEL